MSKSRGEGGRRGGVVVEREEVRERVQKRKSRGDGGGPSEFPSGKGDVRSVHKHVAKPRKARVYCVDRADTCACIFPVSVSIKNDRQVTFSMIIFGVRGIESIERSEVEV